MLNKIFSAPLWLIHSLILIYNSITNIIWEKLYLNQWQEDAFLISKEFKPSNDAIQDRWYAIIKLANDSEYSCPMTKEQFDALDEGDFIKVQLIQFRIHGKIKWGKTGCLRII